MDTGSARAAAERLAAELAAAWNDADAGRFAAQFTTDVDFVNILGEPIRGRDAVVEHHAALFSSAYRGTSLRADVTHAVQIADGVLIAELTGTLSTPVGERVTHALVVATAGESGWSIRAFHNMIPAGG